VRRFTPSFRTAVTQAWDTGQAPRGRLGRIAADIATNPNAVAFESELPDITRLAEAIGFTDTPFRKGGRE